MPIRSSVLSRSHVHCTCLLVLKFAGGGPCGVAYPLELSKTARATTELDRGSWRATSAWIAGAIVVVMKREGVARPIGTDWRSGGRGVKATTRCCQVGPGLLDGKVAHWDYNAWGVIGGEAARDKSRGGELWNSIASGSVKANYSGYPMGDVPG